MSGDTLSFYCGPNDEYVDHNAMIRLTRRESKAEGNMDEVRKAMHSILTIGKDDDENQRVRPWRTYECKAEVQEQSHRRGCCTSKAEYCHPGSALREEFVDNGHKDIV